MKVGSFSVPGSGSAGMEGSIGGAGLVPVWPFAGSWRDDLKARHFALFRLSDSW